MTRLWGDEAGRATKTDRILVLGASEAGRRRALASREPADRLDLAADEAARDLAGIAVGASGRAMRWREAPDCRRRTDGQGTIRAR